MEAFPDQRVQACKDYLLYKTDGDIDTTLEVVLEDLDKIEKSL